MMIEEFIQKAIEGGWNLSPRYIEALHKINKIPRYMSRTAYEEKKWEEIVISYMQRVALIDPIAWQAVGKVEGWKLHDSRWEDGLCTDCYKEETHQADWLVKMHRMIDAVAEGMKPEDYLATNL